MAYYTTRGGVAVTDSIALHETTYRMDDAMMYLYCRMSCVGFRPILRRS